MSSAFGLNGLGSPFGIETTDRWYGHCVLSPGLNGLGSPFGIETTQVALRCLSAIRAKWPGKPVRD